MASAVLHVGDRHSQTSLAENVAAAVTHAAEKVDKKARARIMESLELGKAVFPRNTTPRPYQVPKKDPETDEDKVKREDRQLELNADAQEKALEAMDQYDDQCLLFVQQLKELSTSDTVQAMKNEAVLYEAMVNATGPERVLKFRALYKKVARPSDTQSGILTL